ncbi:ROK family protein [Anditalea andensis]|uniref:ROK family transcriptional regulator n=1 Tax=Anditalea andensis TaxID=1048983 RepID=A0A074LDJ8_9BACT|nr:ROK family protein [Anditalea andensis]KEO71867.1 hypothetical protein EL17_20315 [Anditalea andensis]
MNIYSIGVDIGGSHISCGMYEHSNKVFLKHSKISLPVNNKGSLKEIIGIWGSAISKTINASGVPFEGIGVAVPGPFDYANGISLINGVDKYESLMNVNVRDELASYLNIPPAAIRFINDAAAFATAEAAVGKASEYKRMVGLTLGTGLGSSFCLDGKAVEKGPDVPKGGYLFDKKHGDQLSDDLFSTRGIINHFKKISGRDVATVLDLCQLIPVDEDAHKTMRWFGQELGVFLSPHLKKFEAEVVVLGGNIAKAFQFFHDDLSYHLPNIPIFYSDYGEEAAMMGAALLYEGSGDGSYITASPR